jgi:hypothetical protein
MCFHGRMSWQLRSGLRTWSLKTTLVIWNYPFNTILEPTWVFRCTGKIIHSILCKKHWGSCFSQLRAKTPYFVFIITSKSMLHCFTIYGYGLAVRACNTIQNCYDCLISLGSFTHADKQSNTQTLRNTDSYLNWCISCNLTNSTKYVIPLWIWNKRSHFLIPLCYLEVPLKKINILTCIKGISTFFSQ